MRLLGLLLLALQGSAVAVCLNPFGCEPKNYDECMADATKRATELGVKLARQQCYTKWKQPEDERMAGERTVAAERRATIWFKLPTERHTGVGSWVERLGKPDMVLGPNTCPRLKDEKQPTVKCYFYYWKDERAGRYEAYFRADILDEAGSPIWAYYRDSQSN